MRTGIHYFNAIETYGWPYMVRLTSTAYVGQMRGVHIYDCTVPEINCVIKITQQVFLMPRKYVRNCKPAAHQCQVGYYIRIKYVSEMGLVTKALSLQWHNNGRDCASNHQRLDCLHNRLFMRRSNKNKAPRQWPLWGEFTGNAENVSISWRHRGCCNNNWSLTLGRGCINIFG